jgi:pyruvate,water dikinase
MSDARERSVAVLRGRHDALRNLLDRNGELLELLAEIQLDLRLLVPGNPVVRARTFRLLEATLLQAQTTNILARDRHAQLYDVHAGIEAEVRRVLQEERDRLRSYPTIVPLAGCRQGDQHLVGGKAARLGELVAALPGRVPGGFVVTTAAYARFLAHGGTGARLRVLLEDLDLAADVARLRRQAAEARDVILESPIPDQVASAMRQAVEAQPRAESWAVRSSAVGEDGPFSFAGQFESCLHVPVDELPTAWRRVVASNFSDHVISYRLVCGLFELATPMAVLCMPMVDARCAGVLYTRDPARSEEDTMLVTSQGGLAPGLVGGVADGETFVVSRKELSLAGEDVQAPVAAAPAAAGSPSRDEQRALCRLGLEAEAIFGEALDVEWALDESGRPVLLQARPLTSTPQPEVAQAKPSSACVAQGGVTIVGGRAMGVVAAIEGPSSAEDVPEGSILVVPQASPELAHLLPKIEGLVAEHGSVAGHLASLAREFGVPSVFGMHGALTSLVHGTPVSLDASRCQVHAGVAWPEEGGDTRRRARELRSGARSPLHQLVLRLDLTDPRAASFRPKGCRSLHDIVRFCHERGVAAVFERGPWRHGASQMEARRLRAPGLPNVVWVLDVGSGVLFREEQPDEVEPREVVSRPFQALWRGMTAAGIVWSGRRSVDLMGFASVVSSSLAETPGDADSLGLDSYMIVASDYLNFNGRMAYHYVMIDAIVNETPESNYVNFRFWGGGAGRAQRDLRAVFLDRVLAKLGFAVERRGDLVTARLRCCPEPVSEAGLESLGRLTGCARQLDMLLRSEAAVDQYVTHFLNGDFGEFA